MSKLNERYPNGYMGKIEYWTSKLNAEVMNTKVPNLEEIDRIHRKLDYFIQRQFDTQVILKEPEQPLVGDVFLRSIGILK